MFDFIIEGGVIGMSTVLLSGLGAIVWAIFSAAKFSKAGFITKRHLDAILFLGSLSFFLGVLWQGIGLSEALSVIQQHPGISPAAIAGGIRPLFATSTRPLRASSNLPARYSFMLSR